MLFTEASSEIIDGMEDLGLLPNGAHLYRKPNDIGGHIYYTDSYGLMVQVWNTCLANRSTILAALLAEEHRKYMQQMKELKPDHFPDKPIGDADDS